MKEKILEKISEKIFMDGEKKKIKCADALQIANELGINPKEVGLCCNKNDIKLADCQLGCFK